MATREVRHREQQIAELLLPLPPRRRLRDLAQLIGNVGQQVLIATPEEALARRPARQTLRPLQRRQRLGYPVQGGRIGCRLGCPFCRLDLVPVRRDLLRRLRLHIAEDMRMSTHQLRPDPLAHVVQIEVAVLLRDLGMQHDLHE